MTILPTTLLFIFSTLLNYNRISGKYLLVEMDEGAKAGSRSLSTKQEEELLREEKKEEKLLREEEQEEELLREEEREEAAQEKVMELQGKAV